ncbi:pyridoxamine 5'-phosphate oxidase family protein [Desulfurispira natronophila]|uniref:Pyridoxamine 5'-phosphate oxidase family protein n=1 Tax=Desulfurispira natronophila TaxID=682562 RepID=A0A7W7Y460_9BACT|nr:pyridoxamine 5'-phosphate oxidase family protein [Desulfurispira natronophila]MBB5021712.1 hypothetical protein [Desulfurispira natronophila]
MENIKQYFVDTEGQGTLGTASAEGKVNMALYSKPFFLGGDDQLSFVMAKKLSFRNVQENPHACYLFVESGRGYQGCRIYLRCIEVNEDSSRINQLMEESGYEFSTAQGVNDAALVTFHIEGTVPLVGQTVAHKKG